MTQARDPHEAADESQRLDKWLWFARVVKTRALAAGLVRDGRVRLNGARSESPGRRIKTGDVLTIALEREVRVLRVRSCGSRRGPAAEARTLFEDLSEPNRARPTGPPDPQ